MQYCRKDLRPFLLLLSAVFLSILVVACSVRSNTPTTRFYHNLTTRYNVYYNGKNAFDAALEQQLVNAPDNYVDKLFLEPILATKNSEIKASGGPFDPAIEKGRKAIRLHSIRTRPRDKDRSRKNQAFFKKREYNTFIYKAWLLVGESQYHNGDFLDAMATFSYMARLYRDDPQIRKMARIWQARCYLAMNWNGDAARIIDALRQEEGSLAMPLFAKASIELAIAESRFSEAIPLLDIAIKKEKNKRARLRYRFLKGQLLTECDQYSQATQAFQRVLSSAPSFPMEVAARLNIIALEGKNNAPKAEKELYAMMRRSRYEKVIDKIALAKGRLELSRKDSTAALTSFLEGAEKSSEKGYDYALCQFEAAQILLSKRRYVPAAEALSAAISAMDQQFPDYEEWKSLSEDLDEVAGHARVVMEQDSLLHLAAMPEKERFRIIDSAITAYKKRMREEKRMEQMAQQQENQQAFNEEMGSWNSSREQDIVKEEITDKNFYFYNSQLVDRGKKEFIQKWGNRKLEDDWRRRNKQINPSAESVLSEQDTSHNEKDDLSEDENESDAADQKEIEEAQNPEKRAYYLSSLPFSEEQKQNSYELIQAGYVGMGVVLSERMMRYSEAVEPYEILLQRFPNYHDRMTIFYRLFLLYELMGDKAGAAKYRSLMQHYFPDESLTKEIARPDYLHTMQKQDSIENAIYEKAFQAYWDAQPQRCIDECNNLLDHYQISLLRPKALFLQALSYVLLGDTNHFSQTLRSLLTAYPKSEVAGLAEAMLSNLLAGRSIVRGGYARIDFSHLYMSDSVAQEYSEIHFSKPAFGERYATLLLYPHDAFAPNELLFAVTAFNFAQFTEENLDLKLKRSPIFDLLTIKGLPSIDKARQYIRAAHAPNGFMPLLDSIAVLIPISENNLKSLEAGGAIGDYMNFVADSLTAHFPESAFALEHFAALAQSMQDDGEASLEEPSAAASPSINRINEPAQKPESAHEKKQNKGYDKSLHPEEPTEEKNPQKSALISEEQIRREDNALSIKTDSLHPVLDTLQYSLPATPPKTSSADSSEIKTERNAGITLEDVVELRKNRIIEDKEKAKEEKIEKQQQERERMARLRQREKERRQREKARAKERREREKQRKIELREREKQRKEKLRERERQRRERLRNRNR